MERTGLNGNRLFTGQTLKGKAEREEDTYQKHACKRQLLLGSSLFKRNFYEKFWAF